MNYYEEQLQKLGNIRTGQAVTVKFNHEGRRGTNWLSLSDESATAIVKMLTKNFNIQSDKFGGNWCLYDIISKADEMGYKIEDIEAREIAAEIAANHDSSVGINWDVIERAINEYLEN